MARLERPWPVRVDCLKADSHSRLLQLSSHQPSLSRILLLFSTQGESMYSNQNDGGQECREHSEMVGRVACDSSKRSSRDSPEESPLKISGSMSLRDRPLSLSLCLSFSLHFTRPPSINRPPQSSKMSSYIETSMWCWVQWSIFLCLKHLLIDSGKLSLGMWLSQADLTKKREEQILSCGVNFCCSCACSFSLALAAAQGDPSLQGNSRAAGAALEMIPTMACQRCRSRRRSINSDYRCETIWCM